jgi:hypothetical protein
MYGIKRGTIETEEANGIWNVTGDSFYAYFIQYTEHPIHDPVKEVLEQESMFVDKTKMSTNHINRSVYTVYEVDQVETVCHYKNFLHAIWRLITRQPLHTTNVSRVNHSYLEGYYVNKELSPKFVQRHVTVCFPIVVYKEEG